MTDTGRNDPCPCGSAKKYKRCCAGIADKRPPEAPATYGDLFRTALALERAGRLREAEAGYRQILQIEPNHIDALRHLGRLALKAGRGELALGLMKKAVAAAPGNAICHDNLGNVLLEQGKASEAADCHRKAIALRPDFAEAHNNLGVTLKALGQLDQACGSFHRAIALKPEYAAAHNNLGLALHALGRLDEAAASYAKAIAIEPDYAAAYYNLGAALNARGRFDEACHRFRKALSIQPDFAEASNSLGIALWKLDRLNEAAASFRQALALNPRYVEAHNNLAMVLYELMGRPDEAVASLNKALALKPGFIEAHANLGIVLHPLGRAEEAYSCLHRALALKPDYVPAYNNLLFAHTYRHDLPAEAQRALAAGWEKAALSESDRAAACARRSAFTPRSGSRLRLGIVSAELGQHAVADFLEPVLEELDRGRVHLTLYPTVLRCGARANRFKELAEQWKPLTGIPDAEAAAAIRSDRIDVLVDTTGHACACRLGIFAHRAAPVQCHYLGNCGTTGLAEMDWFIADADLLPAECDTQFRERIWRLPRLWIAYRGDRSLPESGWQPDASGAVWLGSFNNLEKVRHDTCRLWARAMKAIPDSKLLLKDRTTACEPVRQRILYELAGHGIAGERVEFAARAPGWKAHMEMYDRVDIALDPIPLNSGTTAFDALWMGAPLVTLEGDWMGGRMGAAILRALGRPEWVTRSEEQYAAAVAALAPDVEGRRALRASQRALMAGSSLCDAKALARALEEAFETMLDDWGQGLAHRAGEMAAC